MNKIIIVTLSLLVASGCTKFDLFNKSSHKANSEPSHIVPNELIVKGERLAVDKLLAKTGLSGQVSQLIPGKSIYKVQFNSTVDVESVVKSWKGQDGIGYVELNYKVNINYSMKPTEWPKDKFFFKQWAHNNIGQSPPYGIPGARGADMGMIEAWSVSKGSKDVVVAVIDTGIDYTHPDLKENMWVNDKESEQGGGKPGYDDDGNGYTDDVYGYDFVSMDRTALHYGQVGDPDPMDEGGHGTHCAGSIGAIANNDKGVVGVNWNVRMMALRFLGDGGGTNADAARAIYYAIDKKVDVMSNSWGGTSTSKLISEAIADAQKAGILFVAAAGNDGVSNDIEPHYPSSFDESEEGVVLENVLAVAATDNQDNLADFSNYGHKSVHVAAPGVEIISTYPVHKLPPGANPYAIMSGTSMATPYVAGVAALMMAADPSLKGKPALVKNILISSSDLKDSLIGKTQSNGRVNAFKALTTKSDNPTTKPEWQEMSYAINQKTYNQELVDIRYEIDVPKAKAVKVHFNFLQIEEPYDSVYIYDKNQRLINRVEELETRSYWSPVIPGDKVIVRFVNSKVKRMEMTFKMDQYSENSCLIQGAEEVFQQPDGKYSCQVDSNDSSKDTKIYNSFGSQGFSIDRVAYLPTEDVVEGK